MKDTTSTTTNPIDATLLALEPLEKFFELLEDVDEPVAIVGHALLEGARRTILRDYLARG